MRVPLIDGVILTYPEVHRDERGTFSCAGAMDVRATPSHLLLPAGTHLVRSCAARSVSRHVHRATRRTPSVSTGFHPVPWHSVQSFLAMSNPRPEF